MKLSRINTGLLVLIIVINSFVLLMPFWPAVAFGWENRMTDRRQELTDRVRQDPPAPEGQTLDSLIIPSILLDQPIHQGRTEKTLSHGLWLRPNASTPDRGGNTVIVGHRFTYTNPRGTFYLLDKITPGDEIGVFWAQKTYVYKVIKTEVVPATTLAVEAPTDQPTLTLYTCTPLWNAKDRLVVTATLEQTRE